VVLLRDGEEGDRMILTAHWEAFSDGNALHNVCGKMCVISSLVSQHLVGGPRTATAFTFFCGMKGRIR